MTECSITKMGPEPFCDGQLAALCDAPGPPYTTGV